MKENLLKFGIKVLVISGLLYVVWSFGGRDLYLSLIYPASTFLLRFLASKPHHFALELSGFSILIPFLSLALATKTSNLKSKLYQTLIGTGAIIAWNFLLVSIWYFLYDKVVDRETVALLQRITLLFFSGILPFLVWVILFKDSLKKLFYPKKRKRARAAA